MQTRVDKLLVAVFDRLAAASGPLYLQNPRQLLEQLQHLLSSGALQAACPVTCIPFADEPGCKPLIMRPCGCVVSSTAYARAEQECPVCRTQLLPQSSHNDPELCQRTLRRAQGMQEQWLHPVALPPAVGSSDFIAGRILGTGGEGTVQEAKWRGEKIAVKFVQDLTVPECHRLLHGLADAYLAAQRSLHVCPIYGYAIKCHGTLREVYMLLQLCSCSLYQRVRGGGASVAHKAALAQREVLKICADVAACLADLHQTLHLWHLDVSPHNILLTEAGKPLLADFGIAVRGFTRCTSMAGVGRGKERYAAPEQAFGKAYAATDVYSLGATLHFAVSGMPPERPCNDNVVAFEGDSSSALAQLASSMLQHDPKKRPPMDEVAQKLSTLAAVRHCSCPII